MAMRFFLFVALCSGLVVAVASLPAMSAQNPSNRIFVNVVLVQLNVAVTDRTGTTSRGCVRKTL